MNNQISEVTENNSRQIKIGVLVIGAILLMILGFNFLKGNSLFSSKHTYHSSFNSAKGLSASNSVNLLGVEVGKVEAVNFNDNFDGIKVTFTLDNHVKLPSDTKVLIEPGIPGFGSPMLKLKLGESSNYISPGGTVESIAPVTITDKANQLVDNIAPTVTNLNSVLTTLDSVAYSVNKLLGGTNGKNLENSIASLNGTLINLRKTSQSVNGLIDGQTKSLEDIISNMSSITSNLADNKDTINQMLSNFNATSKQIATLELEETLSNANSTFIKLNETIDKINNGKGSVSLLLNDAELYNNLNNTARDLDRLILDLKENPNEYIPNISVFGKKDKQKDK